MTISIVLFIIYIVLVFVGCCMTLFYRKPFGFIVLFFGLCFLSAGIILNNENKPVEKPKSQTVVLFENENNQVDTLVFEGDTIHANAYDIW